MSITPFKGRETPDRSYRHAYRNLITGKWSLRDPFRGTVTGHADAVVLINCLFHVSRPGRERVVRTGRKEVHAWVDGRVGLGENPADLRGLERVRYNPKAGWEFFRAADGMPVRRSPRVVLAADGTVWADLQHMPAVKPADAQHSTSVA